MRFAEFSHSSPHDGRSLPNILVSFQVAPLANAWTVNATALMLNVISRHLEYGAGPTRLEENQRNSAWASTLASEARKIGNLRKKPWIEPRHEGLIFFFANIWRLLQFNRQLEERWEGSLDRYVPIQYIWWKKANPAATLTLISTHWNKRWNNWLLVKANELV